MYAIVCVPLNPPTVLYCTIIGLLAMVGDLPSYATIVRRNFNVYYSHSWEPVPQIPRVGVMYAYGSPHHYEV